MSKTDQLMKWVYIILPVVYLKYAVDQYVKD